MCAVRAHGENQDLVLFSAWHHGSTTVHQNHIFSMLFSVQFISSVSQLCCRPSVPHCNLFLFSLSLSSMVCLSVWEINEICSVGCLQRLHWGMRKQYDHGHVPVQQAQIHLLNVITLGWMYSGNSSFIWKDMCYTNQLRWCHSICDVNDSSFTKPQPFVCVCVCFHGCSEMSALIRHEFSTVYESQVWRGEM